MNANSLHCYYCFDVLVAHLNGTSEPTPYFLEDDDAPAPQSPLFVTWSTVESDGSLPLRGCIGNFSPLPLDAGLKEYALISAVHDRRFAPITASELPALHVGVSLLSDFDDCADALDWTLGEHGIRAFYRPRPGSRDTAERSATFLPEVPTAQGWTKEKTLIALAHKALSGRGGMHPVKYERAVAEIRRLQRYTSTKAGVSWAEYLEWKQRESDGSPSASSE
ncbi:AMMECR1 domain-containing protein [Blastocladiella britannica]|nr:AMMECR1 domain-containing protein [Blastocladiella britannica]